MTVTAWSCAWARAGRGEGELPAGGDGVAGSGVGPGVQDQDHGVVEGAAPGVALALGVVLGAAVALAVAAQLAEGGGVAAGFGEEVPAVAEGVGPFAQPGPGGDEAAVAECLMAEAYAIRVLDALQPGQVAEVRNYDGTNVLAAPPNLHELQTRHRYFTNGDA